MNIKTETEKIIVSGGYPLEIVLSLGRKKFKYPLATLYYKEYFNSARIEWMAFKDPDGKDVIHANGLIVAFFQLEIERSEEAVIPW